MSRARASAPFCELPASLITGLLVALVSGAPPAAAADFSAVPDASALFGGIATIAASDDPVRAFANPAGPAFLEDTRIASSVTVGDGVSPLQQAMYVHAFALATGADEAGSALWVAAGGRDAVNAPVPLPASELGVGYTYARSVGPLASLGIQGRYVRVRLRPADAARPDAVQDAHLLALDVGMLAAAGHRTVFGGRIDGLVTVRQAAGGQVPEASLPVYGPALNGGVAYQPNGYLVLEADAVDVANLQGRQSVRLEARLYPVSGMALRLGMNQHLPSGDGGFMAGVSVEAPGKKWALSYAYLGGRLYGGAHQVGLIMVP